MTTSPRRRAHFHDGIHVGRLAVKMHRQDRPGAIRNRVLDRAWIKRERRRINVDQHCPRSNIADGGHAGDEREWHRNYFIAGPNSCRQQGQVQGASSRIQSDTLRRSAISCELFFKSGDLGQSTNWLLLSSAVSWLECYVIANLLVTCRTSHSIRGSFKP